MGLILCLQLGLWLVDHLPGAQAHLLKALSLAVGSTELSQTPTQILKLLQWLFCLWIVAKWCFCGETNAQDLLF